MKKGLLAVFLLVFVAIIFYFLAPSSVKIQQQEIVRVNWKAFSRNILDEKTWLSFWPEKNDGMQSTDGKFLLRFNDANYSLVEKKMNSLTIAIKKDNDSFVTSLLFVPLSPDSVSVIWTGEKISSAFNRFQNYSQAKQLNQNIKTLLSSIRQFFTDSTKLYAGLQIKETIVVDSLLIFTKALYKNYPTTDSVYQLADKLKTFADKKAVNITGYPMLNLLPIQGKGWLTQVALPINKKVGNEGDVAFKQMLGLGNILVTEVKGGQHAIDNGFVTMNYFLEETNRTAPAMQFQSLVTDRRTEKDSTKWITKLYWPVM